MGKENFFKKEIVNEIPNAKLEYVINNPEIFNKWLEAKGNNAFNNPGIAICVDQDTGEHTAHILCEDYRHIRGETLSFSQKQKENLERDISKVRKKRLKIVSFWWRDGDEKKNQSF